MNLSNIALLDPRSMDAMARIVHLAWCAFQLGAGQNYNEQPDDEDIASNTRSIVDFLQHPDRTPEMAHELWMKDRIEHGWVYGAVKNKEAKTHPDLVPYDQLPAIERAKDVNHLMALRFAVQFFGGEIE